MNEAPKARTEGVVTEQVEDELVIYDELTQTAHCLSAAAAAVWERCDGKLLRAEIAETLALLPATVDQAVEELDGCCLLDDGSVPDGGYSRREASIRLAKVGVAAFSVPLIYSAVIGSAALAASCVPNASGCLPNGASETTVCTAPNGGKGNDSKCCSCACYDPLIGTAICASATCHLPLSICTAGSQCCSGSCVLLVCA